MGIRELSSEESRSHYDKKFRSLKLGSFFNIQISPSLYSIFHVQKVEGNNLEVIELTSTKNLDVLNSIGEKLTTTTYSYCPEDCLNVLNAGTRSKDEHDKDTLTTRKCNTLREYFLANKKIILSPIASTPVFICLWYDLNDNIKYEFSFDDSCPEHWDEYEFSITELID